MASGRLILAIETSNPSAGGDGSVSAGVALVRSRAGGRIEVMGVEALEPTGRHDDDLMPAIDRLFSRTGTHRRAINRVAVSIGPGGYTGLRVAVTTANVIAQACGAEAVGVPTAVALFRRATVPEPAAVCLAVKGPSVWVHRFPQGSARVAAAESLIDGRLRGVVADRFLPDEVRAVLLARGVVVEEPLYDPVAVAEASIGIEASGPISALYAREPEAVTRWRERHG